MGSGRFSPSEYAKAATDYKKQSKESLFQSKLYAAFNPLAITARESCASKEHPDPTSIVIACDVTGSMGQIPDSLLKGGLGNIMTSLLNTKSISNPQVMFAAIGDVLYDQAPLQVTQFESDNRIVEQLKNLFLEGGGGGNDAESYEAIWYFAAHKTRIDSLKAGKKGILFTMGDELVLPILKAEHIRKFMDKDYFGPDIPISQLLKEVTEKYDIFHLIVEGGSFYRSNAAKVKNCWKGYLGERAILVPDYTKIPETITATIASLCELSRPMQLIQKKLEETKLTEIQSSPTLTFSSPSMVSASAVLTKDTENTPHLFLCPISHGVMQEPVTAEDGYNYERSEIVQWFEKQDISPMTGKSIGKILIPNHALKSEIKTWQETQTAKVLAKAF